MPLRPLPKSFDPKSFIQTRLPLAAVPGLAGIQIHLATAQSGLGRLLRRDATPPYWAYIWAGGLALAHHLRANPQTVAGKRVLDLGAGSGIVGIIAAQSGATIVLAAETDPIGQTAITLNADANHVVVNVIGDDLLTGSPPRSVPPVDVILVGDLFYDPGLADRVLGFLDDCQTAGIMVLIGDPGRAALPHARLQRVAEYNVRDMGDPTDGPDRIGQVLTLIPKGHNLAAGHR